MEANYSYQSITNPRVEGWLENFNQQDFREGAKGLNSLHLVSSPSTLNSSSNYNEWMELHENLECNELEAFKDVLLPETKDFGPDFFVLENSLIVPDIFDTELSANDDNYVTDDKFLVGNYEFVESNNDQYDTDDKFLLGNYEAGLSNDRYDTDDKLLLGNYEIAGPSEKPKITTIKLKKVRVPKKKKLGQQNFKVYDYEVVSSPSEPEGGDNIFGKEMYFTDSSPTFIDNSLKDYYLNQFECSFSDDFNTDDDIDLNYSKENEILRTETPSNLLTLKEAITMENADMILDSYLSPERSIFSSGSSPQGQLVNLSLREKNIFSPGTSSQCSDSEGALSPSSSLDDALFEMNLAETDTQILPSNEFSTSSLKTEKEHTRRGRKPRQKMTAESKYLRKKEQNKQAALRYRAKKKLEDEHLMLTLKEEENRHMKLKRESKNLSQEMKFMKKLMKESLLARNLVPSNALQ